MTVAFSLHHFFHFFAAFVPRMICLCQHYKLIWVHTSPLAMQPLAFARFPWPKPSTTFRLILVNCRMFHAQIVMHSSSAMSTPRVRLLAYHFWPNRLWQSQKRVSGYNSIELLHHCTIDFTQPWTKWLDRIQNTFDSLFISRQEFVRAAQFLFKITLHQIVCRHVRL